VISLAFCNELLAAEGHTIQEQCHLIKSLGYDGIELAPGALGVDPLDATKAEIASIKTAIESAGLQLTGLHWLLASFPKLSVTQAAARQDTIGVLKRLNSLCAQLGGSVMVHGSPQQRTIAFGEEAAGFFNACEVFKPVADHAASLGLTYCIEPLDPSQTSFINTVEQGIELCSAVGNPSFMTMIDTSSSHFSEKNPVATVMNQWLSDRRIGHIHLNDSNRGAPGMGHDPFGDIVGAIVDSQWSKTVTIEPFRVQNNATETARIGIDTIRRLESERQLS